jgi:hypothetical protein
MTEDDEGKKVTNATGDEFGRVMEIEHGLRTSTPTRDWPTTSALR